MQVQPQTGLIPLQRSQAPFQPAEEQPLQRVAPAQAAAGDAGGEEKKILGYSAITWQKIIPLGAMFFCILFNYTILRDTKVRSSPLEAQGSSRAAEGAPRRDRARMPRLRPATARWPW